MSTNLLQKYIDDQLAQQQQESSERGKLYDSFLNRYQEVIGHVSNASDLRAGGSTDVLSLRFGLLQKARDEEMERAKFISGLLTSAGDESQNRDKRKE